MAGLAAGEQNAHPDVFNVKVREATENKALKL